MKKPDLSKWKMNPELEGLLIFAQTLDEMLFHHTIDTYKAPSLNLHTCILEFRTLSHQLFNSKISYATIVPVIEELEYKLKLDPLINYIQTPVFWSYIDRLNKIKDDPRELMEISEALLSEMHEYYWQGIRKAIIEILSKPEKKKELISLTSIFITEAELQGIERGFIYHSTQNFFFNPDVQPRQIQTIDQVTEFLDIFYKSPINWKVIFRGANIFKEMIDYAKHFEVQITSDCPKEMPQGYIFNSFLGKSTDYPLFIIIDIKNNANIKDQISARDHANESIDLLSDYYSFLFHEEQIRINKAALVINKDNNEATILNPTPNPMKCGIQRHTIFGVKESDKFIEILAGAHFDDYSTYIFHKLFDYHRAALEAKTPENQLLDLWASLEGFLPSPSEKESRIRYYLESIIPSLTLTYIEKIFRYLSDSLYHGGGNIREIIESSHIQGEFFDKAMAIIVSEDMQETREKLYSELDNHPLLRFRIYEANEHFKSTKHILTTIDDHKQRVAWHIQRIYSTRNQIIHSAESLPYLSTIIENLHSYIDLLIQTISIIGVKSLRTMSIPGALRILFIHEQSYLKELKENDVKINSDNYGDLLFGKNNPVGPYDKFPILKKTN